ncbi:MAG: hypothetical protein FJW99_02215 [Actinobacteria bacterium]|nr:hypothetical protein [Actinomycetota bacterium]
MGKKPVVADDRYRARRWAAARRRMRSTTVWTILGLAAFVPLCAYAASTRGTAWTVGGGVISAVLVLGFAVLFAWRAAGRSATSQLIRDWATSRGWAYWGRDMPAQPAADPSEHLFDLQQLADASFPEATPLLRMGARRYVTDVVAGAVDGVPTRIASHCYEEDTYGSKGERHTTYTYDLVALLEHPLRVTPMRLVRRSAVERLFRGAGDAARGWGQMRVQDLENDLFRERYAVQVADDADPVDVFAVFDPSVQEQLAERRVIPDIDLIEAEGGWLLLAWSGEIDGDELHRLDAMVDAVRWAVATLGARRDASR